MMQPVESCRGRSSKDRLPKSNGNRTAEALRRGVTATDAYRNFSASQRLGGSIIACGMTPQGLCGHNAAMPTFKPILNQLLRYFIAGVFAVLPLVITFAVVMWVADLLGRFLGPGTLIGGALRSLGLQFSSNSALAYVVGWVFVLGVIFVLGLLVELGARKLIQGKLDSLAARVPLLGGVYGTVRQLVGMMDKSQNADLQGMTVVFCTFGQSGGAAVLALLASPQSFRIGEVDYNAVIVPTAPVPVGGGLIFVPTSNVRPANITVDAFMSIYVSMGVTGPQFLAAETPSAGPAAT
jgi:uncharacterized membrane protein